MLYDFHQKQNRRKPGSVHATYILTGVQTQTRPVHVNGGKQEDESDAHMASSPFPGSSAPEPSSQQNEEVHTNKTIILTKEESLEGALRPCLPPASYAYRGYTDDNLKMPKHDLMR